jgi:S-adenosyl-L-methionine hydrolase (adenosine-forming)
MPIITLLTDFGLRDTFIGVMKGVIWSIAPNVQIADLTHEIPPQRVVDGALAIAGAAPYFPAGTIHVCVVDPGVGTARRPMLAAIGNQYFIGPDNGLFSLLIQKAADLTTPPVYIALTKTHYWLPQVSNSFHGRDIFAPVAAHLANGVQLEELGDPFENPFMISIPVPKKTATGWIGQVMQVDHFGNLVTNITHEQLKPGIGVNISVRNTKLGEVVTTFGSKPAGELIAMLDSSGHLAISVVNGSAADRLNVHADEPVTLTFTSEQSS